MKNGSSGACFLRKRGAGRRFILKESSFDGRIKAAGTAKDPIYEKDREHTLFFTQKSQKTFESPFYGILIMRYCVHRESPGNKTDIQEGNTMKDFELRYVGSHVEVYTGSGVFLFSADTVREAMEELAG